MSIIKLMISPTKTTLIRCDSQGDGHFRSKRKGHLHRGIDYVCVPGQEIVSPIDGRITRVALPYGPEFPFHGCVIENSNIRIKMFYFEPKSALIGALVSIGDVIGVAEDISKKPGNKGMIPHIHLQIEWINPDILVIG